MISKNNGILTNVEVLEFLKEKKDLREKSSSRNEMVEPSDPLRNRDKVEKQTLDFLQDQDNTISETTVEMNSKFLAEMKKLQAENDDYYVTESEFLQLCNQVPNQEVELFLILEDCDKRYTSEMLEKILSVIKTCFNLPDDEE